jgi:hypothetical protein
MQISLDNTVAQNAEIHARFKVGNKRLLEMLARHDELMGSIFDLVGIPK